MGQVGQADIFLFDLSQRALEALVVDPANDFTPIWSNAGDRIAFASVRNGPIDLYMTPTDGSGPAEPIFQNEHAKWPSSWSPDDELLAFHQEQPETGFDIWLYSVEDGDVSLLRGEPFNELYPEFSPTGSWLAYQADDSGEYEVYVVPFPGQGPRCKVSTSGGEDPRWTGDGSELFYRNGTTALVVSAASLSGCATQPPQPQELFDGLDQDLWDVHPGGESFVTLEPLPQPRLRLVQNFFEELRQMVPD